MSSTTYTTQTDDRIMTRFNILLEKARFDFKQYQYDGVKWCVNNELRTNGIKSANGISNISGGFIADEMGLGKTIMMIGTMFANFLPRTLIVVPPILIQQWFNEIYKTTGHKSVLYYGNNKKKITQQSINSATIVLTTYNTLLPNDCLLKNLVWDRVIFDEAHHLRNSKTSRYTSCKQIKANIRWLVTGTPIQNKKRDLYNLCNMVGLSPLFYKDPANLRIIGRNYVLRRTKEQVGLNLPPINKQNYIVKWKNKKEMLLSEEIHALLPKQSGVSGDKRRKLAELFGPGGTLVAILRARQSCVLPNMMREKLDAFNNSNYAEALNCSSKLDAVTDLVLERKNNGKGKIVFCHFQSEIDAIAQKLLDGGLTTVVKYDGRNSSPKKLSTLSEPADALVIQIQTGCEGLNLQQNFSEIYFVTPHWNPCVEDQSIARCHRIGQTKPVDVFKFEMDGFNKDINSEIKPVTLDNYVNQVQDLKRDISKQILNIK